MQDPLKQGLKLKIAWEYETKECIRMQDPLKQGLKLVFCDFLRTFSKDSNARSIKTRIETNISTIPAIGMRRIRMQDPLKQGLKQ